MTDTQQNLLKKKTSQTEKEYDWEESSDLSNSQGDQDAMSLSPSIAKEDLTVLKGVGPHLAEILDKEGIKTPKELSQSTVTRLTQINGIGQATAQKIIEVAKQYVRLKKLNDFSPLEEDNYSNRIIKKTSSKQIDIYKNHKGRKEPEIEPWFEEKFNYSRVTDRDGITRNEIKNPEVEGIEESEYNESNLDYEEIPEDDVSEIISPIDDTKRHLRPLDKAFRLEENTELIEDLRFQESNNIIEKLYEKIKLSDFSNIEKSQKLRSVFAGIDALALKLIHVHEFLDLICIVPIIISKLEGSLTVSANSIDYTPLNENERSFLTKKIPQSYIKALQKTEVTILKNLRSRGELLEYIMRYFHIEIYPEKTISHKTLFLRSGPLQYELLIEPTIVSKNKVGFTEKLIPFAYQRQSNIHVVDISQLPDLLNYIDQKYFLIETYSEKKSAVALSSEAVNKFMKELRIVSLPFIVYGFVLFLVLLFQRYSLLKLAIDLGYGVMSLYMLIIGYIYIKYKKKIGQIKQEFTTPYYQRDLGLDETSLVLINERFTPKLMEQFGYELLGKSPDSPILKKIEQNNAISYQMNKIMKKRVEKIKLFEEDNLKPDTPKSKIKNDLLEKYSSFLED